MTCENTRKAIQDLSHGGWIDLAYGIEHNPTTLLQAMTDDGILHGWLDSNRRPNYIVPSKHVHTWHVESVSPGDSYVVVHCTTCHKEATLSSRLPIEEPK
jgi:hypothetical protein